MCGKAGLLILVVGIAAVGLLAGALAWREAHPPCGCGPDGCGCPYGSRCDCPDDGRR